MKRVLVLEDSLCIRTILYYNLNKKYRVDLKSDGCEGIKWLEKKNQPDIILTDLEMKSVSGLDFIKYLKCSDNYKNIPVVVISGSRSKEYMKELQKEYGIAHCLSKPFNPVELDRVIENSLN